MSIGGGSRVSDGGDLVGHRGWVFEESDFFQAIGQGVNDGGCVRGE